MLAPGSRPTLAALVGLWLLAGCEPAAMEDDAALAADAGVVDGGAIDGAASADAGAIDAGPSSLDAGSPDVGMTSMDASVEASVTDDAPTAADAAVDDATAMLDAGVEGGTDGGVDAFVALDAPVPPDAPVAACGDGVLAATEACDDGDRVSGDGCDASCALESVFDLPSPSIRFRGALGSSSPTYRRTGSTIAPIPDQTCSSSLSEAGVRYATYRVRNTTGARFRLRVRVSFGSDGYVYAYTAFDPSNALVGCISANDDEDFDNTRSRVHPWVEPGGEITLVITEYGAGDVTGPFDVTIDASP